MLKTKQSIKHLLKDCRSASWEALRLSLL